MPAPRYGSLPDDVPWIAAPRAARPRRRPRVLLVESDAMLGFALLGVLEGRFDVELARDTIRALQALATASFDVVLADDDLAGGRRGTDFLRECRHRHPRVRRLLMTADRDTLPRGEVPWEAALQKPFELEELVETLSERVPETVTTP